MAKRRQQHTRLSPRRERNHVLSVEVTSPRIIAHTLFSKTRKLVIYGLVTLILVLLAWAVFRASKYLFIEGERFHLTEIKISPEPEADSFCSYVTLPKLTGLECGESIFSYDLDKMEDILEAYPEIKKASLSRRLPGMISIQIEEHVPIASISHNGEQLLVESEGLCFKSKLAVSSLWKTLPTLIPLYQHDLPIEQETGRLSDIGLKRALHLASKWAELNPLDQLLSITVKNYHSLEAITKDGSSLLFGYYEHERQIQDYQALLSHAEKNELAVRNVNLLPFKNIPVTFDRKPKPTRRHHASPSTTPNEKSPEEDILLILEQG